VLNRSALTRWTLVLVGPPSTAVMVSTTTRSFTPTRPRCGFRPAHIVPGHVVQVDVAARDVAGRIFRQHVMPAPTRTTSLQPMSAGHHTRGRVFFHHGIIDRIGWAGRKGGFVRRQKSRSRLIVLHAVWAADAIAG